MSRLVRHPVLAGLDGLGWFAAESWFAWWVWLRALFADPLDLDRPEDVAALALYRKATGRTNWPEQPATEGWPIVGRRGGKSFLASMIVVGFATFVDWTQRLAPGEVARILLLAADREQARIALNYVIGLLESDFRLARLIVSRTRSRIQLMNRVMIEVATSSYKAVRGYSTPLVIADEVAFWRSEDSVNPAGEVIAAIRPALATLPGSLLLAMSTPYAKQGVLHEVYERHWGRDGDPVLVWRQPSAAMNPTLDAGAIARAHADDPAAAQAEWDAEFRSDLESYVTPEVVAVCTVPGRVELPPMAGYNYGAFADASGLGTPRAASMTLGVGHPDHDGRLILDLVHEVRPPASPDAVVAEFAALLARFGITEVVGDAYAGMWPAERFAAHGIQYIVAARTRSDIYRDLLPALTSRRVELLDLPRLRSQILGLERRTGSSGKDVINHAPGRHDDVINAAAGALLVAGELARVESVSYEVTSEERRQVRTVGFRFEDEPSVVYDEDLGRFMDDSDYPRWR